MEKRGALPEEKGEPLALRYNIAPSELVACVRTNLETHEYEWVELKWGLVPSWANDPSIGHKLINARGERGTEKPSFRRAFKQQRCLVLADGFLNGSGKGKRNSPITSDSKIADPLLLMDYPKNGSWTRRIRISG